MDNIEDQLRSKSKVIETIRVSDIDSDNLKEIFNIESSVKSETPDSIGAYEGPQPVLKQFHIYHCIDKKYTFTETQRQPRKYVGGIWAKDIPEAFVKANNEYDSNHEYRALKIRSTSIGDLIQDGYGFYMVCRDDFKLICLVDETGE